MIALTIYEAGIGPCGFHHALTRDPDSGLFIQLVDEDCPTCAAMERHRRQLKHDDDAAEPRVGRGQTVDPKTPRPGDGRRTLARQIDAAEAARLAAPKSNAQKG